MVVTRYVHVHVQYCRKYISYVERQYKFWPAEPAIFADSSACIYLNKSKNNHNQPLNQPYQTPHIQFTFTSTDTMKEDKLPTTSHGIDHRAAGMLDRRSSTKKALMRYDVDGDGIIDQDEAALMAKDLNATEKKVIKTEKDKKSKYYSGCMEVASLFVFISTLLCLILL